MHPNLLKNPSLVLGTIFYRRSSNSIPIPSLMRRASPREPKPALYIIITNYDTRVIKRSVSYTEDGLSCCYSLVSFTQVYSNFNTYCSLISDIHDHLPQTWTCLSLHTS
jgi:hypothetical protein